MGKTLSDKIRYQIADGKKLDYWPIDLSVEDVKESIKDLLDEFNGCSKIEEQYVNRKIREIFGDALCTKDDGGKNE